MMVVRWGWVLLAGILWACGGCADTGTGCPPEGCPAGQACFDGRCVSPDGWGDVGEDGGPCRSNAECDDGHFCNGPEECSDGRCGPGTPLACNDSVECTADGCNADRGRCVHTPNHLLCPDGQLCTVAGCRPGTPCETDPYCDDEVFCNGIEYCDPEFGCQAGPPPDCDDAIGCTLDGCDRTGDRCLSVPNDSACDDGDPCTADRCDPAAGACAAAPLDEDGDTFVGVDCGGDDCDDGDPTRRPGAPELCNDVDDDCDSDTDEGFPCARGTSAQCITRCGTTGTGICTAVCDRPDPLDCTPPAETCNRVDDDCDGVTDDDCACAVDADCDDGDPCTVDACQADLRCFVSPAADDTPCPAGRCCGARCIDDGSDPAHCGSCAGVCAAGSSCSAGACACMGTLLDCDGDWGNGCEVNGATDPAHCGACGTDCGAQAYCLGATCRCTAPYLDCNSDRADGCEVNSASDPAHCGRCGAACDDLAHAAEWCAGGTCMLSACDPGWGNCNGVAADGCEASLATPANCNACGNTCAPGQGCCGGTCVSLATVANCGACGNACSFEERCCGGSCTLPPTTSEAGPDQSVCDVSTTTLAGNPPRVGTGRWVVFSGTASITTPSSPTSEVTGLATPGTATLRWAITNLPCAPSTDDVVITVSALPTRATAGSDQSLACGVATTTLAGNTPGVGTGRWSVVSGSASITTPSSPTSGVTGLAARGTAILRWTISNSPCTPSIDDVFVTTCCGMFTDPRDGRTYNAVSILGTTTPYCLAGAEDQCWMAENLNIGTFVTVGITQTSGVDNQNTSIEKYCYGDNPANCIIYGGLYQWSEMLAYGPGVAGNGPGPRGICPTGWHIPTDNEWKCLEMNLGMTQSQTDLDRRRGTDEGGKIKQVGTTLWLAPNTGATNSSGFTALPGGMRHSTMRFFDATTMAWLWTSTESTGPFLWQRGLQYDSSQVFRYDGSSDSGTVRQYGNSVRCVRD